MRIVEKVAVVVSAAILISAAVYWTIQIRDVRVQLEIAYGGK